MAICETPDFTFPMCMDIFYPIVEQAVYGNVKKQWMHDRTVVCSVSTSGSALKEDITPNINIKQELVIVGRLKTDIRISSRESNNSVTNIIVSNIKDKSGQSVYNETSGPRAGKPTIFEVATLEPFVGPFGKVEYYKIVLRRSENQAVDI
jgi:hypothetical protein